MTDTDWESVVVHMQSLWPRAELNGAQSRRWRHVLGSASRQAVVDALDAAYEEGQYATPRITEVRKHLRRESVSGESTGGPSFWDTLRRHWSAIHPHDAGMYGSMSDYDIERVQLEWECAEAIRRARDYGLPESATAESVESARAAAEQRAAQAAAEGERRLKVLAMRFRNQLDAAARAKLEVAT